MKNTPNNYDYVLSLFKSNDEMRPAITKVFKQQNYYLATDTHALIVIDENLAGLSYEEDEKAPNALGLFEKFETDKEQVIDRDSFLSDIFKLEMQWIGKYKNCEKCKGQGFTECKCCRNDSDCLECDGTGESSDLIPFSKPMLKHGELIQIGDTTFDYNYINKVLMTAFFLGEKQINFKWLSEQKYKPVLFEVGKVKIMLMPKVKS